VARGAPWLAPLLACLACGGASVSSPGPTPPPANLPDPPYFVTVMASGVSPSVTHVWRGRAVIFRNQDGRAHSFYADPHPAHHECAGALNLGALEAGETREVTDLPINACFFHSEEDPSRRAFQGVVVVH
jgi:hypothetical protein